MFAIDELDSPATERREQVPDMEALYRLDDRRPLLGRLRDMFVGLYDRLVGDDENRLPWDVDIRDRTEEVVVRINAPGFEAGEICADVRGGLLVLHGCKSAGCNSGEPRFQEFYHCEPLPPAIDTANVVSQFADGLLTVTLPKKTARVVERTLVINDRAKQPTESGLVARELPQDLRKPAPNWPRRHSSRTPRARPAERLRR